MSVSNLNVMIYRIFFIYVECIFLDCKCLVILAIFLKIIDFTVAYNIDGMSE